MRIPPWFAALTVFVWASGYPVGALGVAVAPPFLLTAIRFLIAAALMALIAFFGRAAWPRGWALVHTAVAGLLIQAFQFSGVYLGLRLGVPASVTALVISCTPVLTAVVAARVFRTRIGVAQLVGLVLGVAAVVLSLGDRLTATDSGAVFTIFGMLAFVAGSVYQQRFCRDIDVRTGSAVQHFVSVPVVALMALAFESGGVTDWSQFWLAMTWLVLVNSMGGATLFLVGIRMGGAARITTLSCLVPSVTALIAWPLLGQGITPGVVAGLVLGSIACWLGTSTPSSRVIRTAVEEPANDG
ncbi:DMT family transporter [Lentzea tibetensis]|uniref:DMT family transporter n=1 Tax=Lentzea tibetensis TaxID=2591470 RepID=A0A563ENA3_9PSEU|nr:DMT family transporter [Lentzea tibetensis]TWP48691.1 DMT family transporter [Lentzea tibetensis]